MWKDAPAQQEAGYNGLTEHREGLPAHFYFDRAQYDEILGLNKQGYASAVIAAVGYRAPSDQYAGATKVRFAKEQIFVHV